MDGWMIAAIVSSTISVAASLAVILTFVLFERMRNKVFMMVIAFVSVGDLIGNFPFMFPYRPNEGNWWCSLQAFMNLSGYPIDWTWTVALVYFLYSLSQTGKLPENMLLIHLVCWLVPIILALAALGSSKYSRPGYGGVEICVNNGTFEARVYHDIAYYGLFYGCFFIMVALFIKIYQAEKKNDPNVMSSAFTVAKSALRWYPLVFVVFWLPHSLSSMIGFNGDDIFDAFLVWKIMHGFATAVIFFAQSQEARRLWWSNTIARCSWFAKPDLDDDTFMGSESVVDRNTEMLGSTISGLSSPSQFSQSVVKSSMHSQGTV